MSTRLPPASVANAHERVALHVRVVDDVQELHEMYSRTSVTSAWA